MRCLAGGELFRESNPYVTFHRPIELALELTDCCARARDFGIAEGECLHFEPSLTFPPLPHWNANLCYVRSVAGGELCRESNPRVTFHRPDGTLRAPLFGLQGGGVAVYSSGVANFESCNIHDNSAYNVCLHRGTFP